MLIFSLNKLLKSIHAFRLLVWLAEFLVCDWNKAVGQILSRSTDFKTLMKYLCFSLNKRRSNKCPVTTTKTVTGDRLNIGYFLNERLSTLHVVQFHSFGFYLHIQKTLSHISLTRMHKYKWERTLRFYGCNPVIFLNCYLRGYGVLPRCQWNKLVENRVFYQDITNKAYKGNGRAKNCSKNPLYCG